MKIAISTDGSDLGAKVERRFGISKYLLIVDPDTMDFEAVLNPGALGQRGAGVQAVALAIDRKAGVVLTGYCSPKARSYLSAYGIEVLTGVTGTVAEVVRQYKRSDLQNQMQYDRKPESSKEKISTTALIHALKSSARQFFNILPILTGVVLLIGLINTFLLNEFVSSVFSGNWALDTFVGTCLGSILAGNPINSYIIGGELLEHGVSLFAVTAFIVAWVTVGLIQLPAEMTALGMKFALVRNA
ncbi:MAG: NifB/NifX family molybdenum-iron cluster-binding protein, partial [Deltaproteobacteria bacterium]|nr:NifB/NifX family molybdenum-iron cluster-binding protein [Deltaproteobacteria bacterium]